MNDVHAFIVGIDRYDESPDWCYTGPVNNACGVARLLLAAGVPPAQIHLFLDYEGAPPPAVAELAAEGLIATRDATFPTIDKFWRSELSRGVPPNSKLFVFWSGHGFTDSETRRVFLCSDYTQAITTRVFNCENFVRQLKGPLGRCFSSQRIFADVCGTYSDASFTVANERCSRLQATEQLVFYATPEGDYAVNSSGVGAFTGALLDALKGLDRWLDEDEVIDRLTDAITRLNVQECRIQGETRLREWDFRPADAAARLSGVMASSALACLNQLSLTPPALAAHFSKTTGQLSLTELRTPNSGLGMVEALAGLSDGDRDLPSFGLYQFMMRVAADRSSAEIEQWLVTHERPGFRNRIEELLDSERPVKRLVVEVHNDPRSEIVRFSARLRNADLSVASESSADEVEVDGWDDFREKIGAIIEKRSEAETSRRIEVDFLVDAPLFDIPFHAIRTPNGETIGDQFKCVVHYLRRPAWRDKWKEYCDGLNALPFADLSRPLCIPSDESLPEGRGICYAGFPLDRGPSCLPKKRKLAKMLKVGAPYMFWLHGDADDAGAQLARELDTLLARARSMRALPDQVADRRLLGAGCANDISLLWDDPRFDTYFASRELST